MLDELPRDIANIIRKYLLQLEIHFHSKKFARVHRELKLYLSLRGDQVIGYNYYYLTGYPVLEPPLLSDSFVDVYIRDGVAYYLYIYQ